MADSTSSNLEEAKSTIPVQAVGISESSKSAVQLGRTNVLKDLAQETINESDTSKREVAGSPHPVGISENSESVVQPDSTCNSLEDSTEEAEAINVLQQIDDDKGEFVKDRSGRFRVVYKDDDNIDEYKTRIKRVKIKADGYSSECLFNMKKFIEGITLQQDNTYPYTVVIIDNEHESITTNESNCYREDIEYREIAPNKKNPLYKHLNENSAVRLVRDISTGFTHICKTNILSKFRCEEVQAMLVLDKIAPKLYVANRDGEYVNLHMELIKGTRLDIVANNIKNKHMWPLCLRIFSEIMYAIDILIDKCTLSHGDIHTQNIIIEVVQEGKFRIRLIDYGEACEYTINNLINDMRSLVATLLALFTRNDFDAYNEEPDNLIKDPSIWKQYPKLWDLFKRALDVKNRESLTTLINYVKDLLVNNCKKTEFNKRLKEIATNLR
jgi:tRNA A-37 threonylcarbamoyl transferase component Bud32